MEKGGSIRIGGARTVPVALAQNEIRLLKADELADPTFRTDWDNLVRQAGEPNPFFEPWFLLPALRALDPDQEVEVVAWFWKGHLSGLLPTRRGSDYYGRPVPHVRGWLHPNAFCGAPLISSGRERAFWRDLIAHFDRDPKRALLLHLPLLSEDGPANAALDRVLAGGKRAHYAAERESRALLAGEPNADAYLAAAMSAKKRKELRRQRSRLGEEGALLFERLEGDEGLEAWIAEFLVLEAAGWKGEAASALASETGTATLFTEALVGAAAAGRLERLALRIDGRAVAMLVNFITPPGAFSFKTAFDEAYARFSPGMLLQLENLALLERTGFEWADSCAAEGHPMIERLWRDKRRMVSRNIAIGGPLRRAAFRLPMAWETRKRST